MLVLPCAKALAQKKIKVTAAVVKVWWAKYKCQGHAEARIKNAQMLQDQHGVLVAEVAREHPTGFKLCKALRERDPPLYISDGVARQWLAKYGGQGVLHYVLNAGHLESWHGNRIRESKPEDITDGTSMAPWLLQHLKVSTSARVCEKWLRTEWSGEGVLLTPIKIEEEIGEQLRLRQYEQCFNDKPAIEALASDLLHGDPPFTVCADTLRQWYDKYHPSSRPLEFATAESIEAEMGDHMREKYTGLRDRALRHALAHRLKPALIGRQGARTWLTKFGSKSGSSSNEQPVLKRSAANSKVLKRPSAAEQPTAKRQCIDKAIDPATAMEGVEAEAGAAKRQCIDKAIDPATAMECIEAEAGAAGETISLNDAKSIENACGVRYRTEVFCLFSAIL